MTEIVRDSVYLNTNDGASADILIAHNADMYGIEFRRIGTRWHAVEGGGWMRMDARFNRYFKRIENWLNERGERDALLRAVERIERQQAAHVALASD